MTTVRLEKIQLTYLKERNKESSEEKECDIQNDFLNNERSFYFQYMIDCICSTKFIYNQHYNFKFNNSFY